MNIFHSTGMYSDKYGGMEKLFVMLAGELSARGHKLFIQFEGPPASRDFIDDIRGNGGSIEVIRTRNRLIRGFFDIYKCIEKNNIRIVHANFSPAKDLCVLAGKLAGVDKIFSHFRNIDTGRTRTGLRLWFVSRFSDLCLAVSMAVKRNLIERGVPSRKIHVLYSGVYAPPVPEKKESVSGRPGAGRLMCIAWDDPVKGVDLLLEAVAIVACKFSDIELWMVGSACNSDRNRKMAQDLRIGNIVAWLGIRDDIPELLNKCDIYIQPSRSESFSLTIAEAMAAEKPVVAFKVGGIPEVVDDGVTGILAAPEDPRSLSEAIIKVLEDRDLGKKMGKEGRERVLRMFDLNKEAVRIADLYEE